MLGILIKSDGKLYQIKERKSGFKLGDQVLVETDQAIEKATIVDLDQPAPKISILRKLKPEDEEKLKVLTDKAKETIVEAQEMIEKHQLPMRILEAEYSFDEKKLTFYFSAPERVDFRDLVTDLAAYFHKLIRLQQIGPRDAAALLGGFGPCGRPLCCQTFLKNLESVSLEMAEKQNLVSLSPSKLSGVCGKLMCCLAYEAELYQKMRKKLPKIGSQIKTEKGKGQIIAQNVLKQSVLVELESGNKIELVCTR